MIKLLCWLGWHTWTASVADYMEEFGSVPRGKIAKKSVCEHCEAKYDESAHV